MESRSFGGSRLKVIKITSLTLLQQWKRCHYPYFQMQLKWNWMVGMMGDKIICFIGVVDIDDDNEPASENIPIVNEVNHPYWNKPGAMVEFAFIIY